MNSTMSISSVSIRDSRSLGILFDPLDKQITQQKVFFQSLEVLNVEVDKGSLFKVNKNSNISVETCNV